MNLHLALDQFLEPKAPIVRSALFDGRHGVEVELGGELKIRMSAYDAAWLAEELARASTEANVKQGELEATWASIVTLPRFPSIHTAGEPQEAAR